VFALSRDLEEEEKASKAAWPDTDLLFGHDPDYQDQVQSMVKQLRTECGNVMTYSRVNGKEESFFLV